MPVPCGMQGLASGYRIKSTLMTRTASIYVNTAHPPGLYTYSDFMIYEIIH